MCLSPTWIPLNFETDLDHYLDAKKKNIKDPDFLIYLLLLALADVYTV